MSILQRNLKNSKMKIHNNLEQGSEEWHYVRKGKMTASNATAIGNNGAGLKTYCKEIIRKEFSSNEERWSNKDTERGNELEPIARQIYEMETGNTVETVGFIEYEDEVGCSPDGLVGEDGGIEIKCPDDKVFFDYILDGEDAISTDYIWQVQMNLLITERKWWDLIIYNPNFKKSMFIFRIYPNAEKFEKLKAGFEIGRNLLKEIRNKINE